MPNTRIPVHAWPGRWGLPTALLILVVGSLLSIRAWHASAADAQAEADAEFERFADLTQAHLAQSVSHQLDLLASFQALFRAGHDVSRADFHRLFADLQVADRFPAVKAIQYSPRISEAQRPALEAAVRQDRSLNPAGYPAYAVHPAGPRPEYVPVVFNEPMQGNEAAFGHDHAHEATRREVMERARDRGTAQASAPVRLLQGQTGFVVRMPVYRRGEALETVEQRRRAYLGQVSGVFVADDLMRSILAGLARTPYGVTVSDVGMDASDPAAPVPATALLARAHGSRAPAPGDDAAPADLRRHALTVGGRWWSLEVSRPAQDPRTAALPLARLIGGIGLTLAVSAMVAHLSRSGRRALLLARRLASQAAGAARRLDAVLDNAADGIVTLAADGRIVSANPAAQAIFGLERERLLGRPLRELLAAAETRNATDPLDEARIGSRQQLAALRADGNVFPIELALRRVELDGSWHWVASIRDLTEAQAADEAIRMTMAELAQAHELNSTMLRHAACAIILTDAAGGVLALNPGAERLLRCTLDDARAPGSVVQLFDADDLARLALEQSRALGHPVAAGLAALASAPREGGGAEHELHLRRPDGTRVPVSVTVTGMHDDDGGLSGHLLIAYDITERRELAQQMARMAFSDGLTGLANRPQLERDLAQSLASAERNGTPLALLFIDLDRFKPINDTHGHAVGDQVLCEVAGRLRSTLRSADVVARVGGDEFVVLLTTLHRAEDCAIVADKLALALSEPMQLAGLSLQVGASIGAVTYPAGGHDAASLLRQADAAMYQAKQAGRSRHRDAAVAIA